MKYNERKDIILMLLKQKHELTIQELQDALHVSPATIRRDLKIMNDNKMIERFHGGIRNLEYVKDEIPIQERKNISLENKRSIARYAAGLIRPGDLIFIDAGTTTLIMIDYIEENSITVITNGIQHIQKLKEKNINSFLLCGFLKNRSNGLLGSETVALMKKFKFDKAFLGTNAIDFNYGISTYDDYEIALKQAGISQSERVYVLADSTKFGRRSLYTISDFDSSKMTFITDKEQPDFTNFKCIAVDLQENQ